MFITTFFDYMLHELGSDLSHDGLSKIESGQAESIETILAQGSGMFQPPKKDVLTPEALQASQDSLQQRWDKDKRIKSTLAAIDRRRKIMKSGEERHVEALKKYRTKQGKLISKLYNTIAKRKASIKKLESKKIALAASIVFNREYNKRFNK